MENCVPQVIAIPRIGMSCMIRNRLAVIMEVKDFSGQSERQYVVKVSYKDSSFPDMEELLWNIEPGTRLLNPTALPDDSPVPMLHKEFDALVRACRWSAIQPFLGNECYGVENRTPISAPFYGAIAPDDYQLVPLLKALRMPRVSLMIADDVGLGKTIEAGLIVNEMLVRRRISRVLIISPASLRMQWKDEMQDKFSLPFDIIDHDSTVKLKREVGIDVNPWRYYNRVITSYHYLKQSLILEQFKSATEQKVGNAKLPWDMLIVDEAHNLMPSPFGKDSDLCQMLREIAPYFEHKIFLTATPHNGNTTSFSGLLEILDPARFRRTEELTEAEKRRIRQVVIRRLKREINERTNPPRFCTRKPPQAILLDDAFSEDELRLIFSVEEFKKAVRSVIAKENRRKQLAGHFAIEVLGKRLLSSPMTFIESWKRCSDSLKQNDTVDDDELSQLKKTLQNEITDDREAEVINAAASSRVGAWLKAFADSLSSEIANINESITRLGIDLSALIIEQNPKHDARFKLLVKKIDELLRDGKEWKNDERLVVFTEYKTTQDYLLRRLSEHYKDTTHRRICVLYGGMADNEREAIKARFNDEGDDIRILLATDAASEGLNLQETARYLLHYDCPWNPSRLEQRNGRLDRHGQARDVFLFHFTSTTDSDLSFLARMITKLDQIREDFGAIGELFDRAIQRRIIHGDNAEDILIDIEKGIGHGAARQIPGEVDNNVGMTDAEEAERQLSDFAAELDLDDNARHNVLWAAMKKEVTELDPNGCFKINKPDLLGWKDTIDETVRVGTNKSTLGGMPQLTFSINPFIVAKGERRVFRSRPDVKMLHLGHPLMRKACSTLTRRRYPGGEQVSRFTVRHGNIDSGLDAHIIVHFEEMAINKLRETFHHWVRSTHFGVKNDQLKELCNNLPPLKSRMKPSSPDDKGLKTAQEIYNDISDKLRTYIKEKVKVLNQRIIEQLETDRQAVINTEKERFQSREGELSAMIRAQTIEAKKKEIERLKAQRNELNALLFKDMAEEKEREIDESIEALERYIRDDIAHYNELRAQLDRERERIMNYLIPNRYVIDGSVQIYPVAIEVILPEKGMVK